MKLLPKLEAIAAILSFVMIFLCGLLGQTAAAAGMNLEDTDHHGGPVLVDAKRHAEKLAAVKAAARVAGVDLFLNARVDTFVHKVGSADEQLEEGLRRAQPA